MNNIALVILSYSINPLIRKQALLHINKPTGYALIQTTTLLGNIMYIYKEHNCIKIATIKKRNIIYSIVSSVLTIVSSYNMNIILSQQNNTAALTTKIQIMTIIISHIIEYIILIEKINIKEIIGILFMISGISIAKL